MNLAILIGLSFLLLCLIFILVYALRVALDSSDTTRIDAIPDDDLNSRNSSSKHEL